MPDFPTGTVTFLFTDIEGSTTRWEHHPESMRAALARHDTLLRSVITAHGGFVFKMMGDAVYAVFAVASDAVAAAVAAQQAVNTEEWGEVGSLRVRMALHTGAAQSRDQDYFGPTLNRVARVLSTGYGGQVLLSVATVELVRDALPMGVTVKDLGEHPLKDLLRPEHVYQLVIPDLPDEFPALKSLERHPHNLPTQPTPFVGREQEMTNLYDLLRRPDVRLVTLTGPAGVGKTRLALQVAAELSDLFADGLFLVPLAPVNDPEQTVPAITQTLGISDLSGQTPLTQLKGVLKDKQMLLVLDNFEQVIPAAVQMAELLAACPQLKIIVTSQVVLRLQAEREFSVSPLSLPNPKRLPDIIALSQYEAVALFIQRSQMVKPDFVVTNANAPAVAAICVRLDGLPLAIELAAARSKFFAPQALLTRLEQGLAMLTGGARDLPARQQTLRGAIAWSYNLLTSEQQILFRRLAVFVDGCMWEAAEIVCRAAGDLVGDVLDGLLSLVDKSLLRQQESTEGEPRFWMLQTLREFGLEVLASAGEMKVTREAHAEYYLALAEEAESHLRGAGQARWFAQLQQEHENLRTGLTFLLEQARVQTETQEGRQHTEQALRLCVALHEFWDSRGYMREGLNFLKRSLVGRSVVAPALGAKALYVASDLAWSIDDAERAEALCGESLSLYRELGDTAGIASCLLLLGTVARTKGQYATARARLEEAALFQEIGDRWRKGRGYTELARIATEQGQYERAHALLEESLELYQALGDQQRIGWVRYLLARLLFVSQQDPARAQRLAEQSLALLRELGDSFIGFPLGLLGQMLLVQGEHVRAHSLLEESVALFQEVGDLGDTPEPLISLARVAMGQGNVALALQRYQECLAMLRELSYQEGILACLEGLGAVIAVQGEPAKAARLWGTVEVQRETMDAPMHPVYRAEYEQAVDAARTELGEEAFAAAWAEGRATPLEQVIDEVLKSAG
ncbi:MAG TPA: tetratricopeptide repeat protein [Ktedonobacteraceae bacterium]|nr:tetratricopeptide repeat protein [Ktedonobacteraceae bacterium]